LTRLLECCPPIRLHCAKLISLLQDIETSNQQASRDNHGPVTPTKSPLKHQTALFTLPFDPNRDSRHNFRSVNEQAVYKNRESIRDVFLNQLRAYYNKNNAQIQQTLKVHSTAHIREAVRTVMNVVQPENMSWFADFFRDLLLQLGPVPVVREADRDLLQKTDSDTLEKLNQRLYSQAPTHSKSKASKKSSQSFVVKRRDKTPTITRSSHGGSARHPNPSLLTQTSEQAQMFKGYQEFFFLFVVTADSFNLGRNLLFSLSQKLKRRLRESSTIGDTLNQRVSELQLLSKFIGVLLFSPYWSVAWTESNLYAAHDPLRLLDVYGISLVEIVLNTKSEQALVLTVPWVVDLLKMARWDPTISNSTRTYDQVLSLLRSLQVGLIEEQFASPTYSFLTSCLESLFHETVGVVHASTLPINWSINPSSSGTRGWQEFAPIPKQMLYSGDAHVEDLVDLITVLSRRTTRKNPTRKLRPIQVKETRRTIDTIRIPEGQEKPPGQGVITSTMMQDPADSHGAAKAKLRDMFFHGKGDLEEIGNFTVGQHLKTIGVVLERECKKLVEERQHDAEEVRARLVSLCERSVNEIMKDRLSKSFDCLSSSKYGVTEKDTACAFFLEYANIAARPTVRSTVATVMKEIEGHRERERKGTMGVETKSTVVMGDRTVAEDELNFLETITTQLIGLTESIEDKEYQTILYHTRRVTGSLELYNAMGGKTLPTTPILRDLYQAVLDLDDRLEDHLGNWIYAKDAELWPVFVELVELTIRINNISCHGLSAIVACVLNPEIRSILSVIAEDATSESTLSSILLKMVEARLLALQNLAQ